MKKSVARPEKPSLPSIGVRYLVVNGILVVDAGEIVSGVAPGRAVVGHTSK